MKTENIANDWEEFTAIWNRLSPAQKSIIIRIAVTRRNRKAYVLTTIVLLVYTVLLILKRKT